MQKCIISTIGREVRESEGYNMRSQGPLLLAIENLKI